MFRSVAPQIFEVHTVFQAATARLVDCVAGFMCSLRNPESLAAERQHFGHEGEITQAASLIERSLYFLKRLDLDEVAGPQPAVHFILVVLPSGRASSVKFNDVPIRRAGQVTCQSSGGFIRRRLQGETSGTPPNVRQGMESQTGPRYHSTVLGGTLNL